MTCYTFEGKTLSEEELFKRMREELATGKYSPHLIEVIYDLKTPESILHDIEIEGKIAKEKLRTNPGTYVSTSTFITAEHIVGTKKMRLTAHLDNKGSRRTLYINDHKDDVEFKGDETLVAKAYDEQIEAETQNKKVGDYIHKFVNVLLTTGITSPEYSEAVEDLKAELLKDNGKFAEAITREDPRFNKDQIELIVNIILNLARSIVSWINNTEGLRPQQRRAIYSELPMLLKKSASLNLKYFNDKGVAQDPEGLFGIADLVIVDNNGKMHLIDYKVCSRSYDQWYEAKKNEVEYQLAIYRAILTSHGINGNDIDIQVKPVLFPKNAISLITTDEGSIDLLRAKTGSTKSARIAWQSGTFTANLRNLGIGTELVYVDHTDTELDKAINEDYNAIMGIKKVPKVVTKEEFIAKKKIEPYRDSNGKIIGYRFWSKLAGTKGDWVTAPTEEEITKDGGLLDQYIAKLESSRNDVLKTIVKEIEEYKVKQEDGKNPELIFLLTEKNPKRKALLQKVLGKYTKAGWTYEANLYPELAEHGILIFKRIDPDTSVATLDIINLAEFDLEDKVQINGNGTLLGKYISDEAANKLPFTPMPATYRNIKALETISILNSILIRHPDTLNDSRIGNIIILNPNGEADDNIGINMEQLKENFNWLCHKDRGNLENKIEQIRTATTYEYCMSELQAVLSNLGEDVPLKKLLHDIDNGTESLATKRKRIVQLLLTLRNKYPLLRNNKFGEHGQFNLNDPAVLCYVILSQMNNYLHNIHIDFDGRIDKWAVDLSLIFSLLGIPFTGKVAKTSADGGKIVGPLGGLDWTSPRTTPSNTLRQLNAYYDAVYQKVRTQFTNETKYVSNLTKSYIKNFNSDFHEFFNSANTKVWERLLVHDGDKINPLLIIKNPYDESNDLTEIDREFLKKILWEINKYRLNLGLELSTDWHYEDHEREIITSDLFNEWTRTNDSEYFQLPLGRSSNFLRLSYLPDFGLKQWFEAKWKDFEETYDPRMLHNERRKQIKNNDITEMYNAYQMTNQERVSLLQSVSNPYDFNFDLDFLALDVAFQYMRKSHFDNALMLTETVTALMELQQQETGQDMSNEIEAAQTQAKITLTNESAIESEEAQKGAKAVGVLRGFNSFALLACRPLMFLKELTFGMFTNFSRAWALKYGSNQLHINTVAKANSIIWGQEFGKYGKAFTGEGSLGDFTLCAELNRIYGIANLDLNRLVKNSSLSRLGKFDNMSKWMYIAQSAPDYFNRLTLFIAKMLEDGCFEAHTLDENGNLTYDWKKDKRFDLLAKYGLNSDHTDPEYNKQKALYAAMCSEFEKTGDDLIKWNAEKKRYEYGDIQQAYTADQKASIKEVADMAYGFYDHESKSQINHKFLGLVFLQFQTFLSAKFNLWLKSPQAKGGNTAQGKFVQMERDGVKYYDKVIIDNEGNLIDMKKVAETDLTEEEKRTLQPSMEWLGDFVEGLFWSIGYTLHDIFTFNWKDIANNKLRMANVMLAMHDIILGIILVALLKALFSNGTNKMEDIKPTQRILLRSLLDVGPSAFTQVSITPSFIETWSNLKNDGIKLLFDGSDKAINTMEKHFGATRDFIWNED